MWNLIYSAVFLFACILSLLLTPIFRAVAIRYNIVDQPGDRKIHKNPIPYLGGLAIYTSMTITLLIGLFVSINLFPTSPYVPLEIMPYLPNIKKVMPQLMALLTGGTLMVILGIIDDIKKLNPFPKLLGQVVISIIVVLMGIRLDFFVSNSIISAALTVFWIIAITNSFNLLDNMDGLSTGVAAIACLLFIIYSYQTGHTYMVLILAIFLGSLLGFLPYNFNPARIFMGDAGSMFIGFQMACLSVLNSYYFYDAPTWLPVLLPLFVLSVPLFDTISVIAIRIRKGKPIYQGDDNHFSHRLVRLGMTQKQAVLCIYLTTFCAGVGALLLRYLPVWGSILILTQVIAIFIVIMLLEYAGRHKNMR